MLHTEPDGKWLDDKSQCDEDDADDGMRIIEVGALTQRNCDDDVPAIQFKAAAWDCHAKFAGKCGEVCTQQGQELCQSTGRFDGTFS